MEGIRKPFQGVANIVRFNWHFYLLAALFVVLLLVVNYGTSFEFNLYIIIISLLILLTASISLLVSLYVYDASGLYSLNWLDGIAIEPIESIVNIHAGFDETSSLIAAKYRGSNLQVFDFYDPLKHTEISIKRARKAYPAYTDTRTINTVEIPLASNVTDLICVILSAHEIRSEKERIVFFSELKRISKSNGKIVVTEHLRDLPNLLAYNIGFFHFFSRVAWNRTFESAELFVLQEIKITPFITCFILTKNGTAS